MNANCSILERRMIPLFKIKKFADSLQVGDKFKMPVSNYSKDDNDNLIIREYTVIKKYPYIVQLTYRSGRHTFTTSMDYTKIYMHNFLQWCEMRPEDAWFGVKYPTQLVDKVQAKEKEKRPYRPHTVAVKCLDTGKVYPTIKDAARDTGIGRKVIAARVHGTFAGRPGELRWCLASSAKATDFLNTR